MEGVLLSTLGRPKKFSGSARPPMPLTVLDEHVCFLQANAIEKSTSGGYATGARDYIKFCLSHGISLDPTPETLARYIAFTSNFIASGPKYLTGVCHFLKDLYLDFDTHRSNPLVTATIRGSKKIRGDPVKRKAPLRPCHLLHLHHPHTQHHQHRYLVRSSPGIIGVRFGSLMFALSLDLEFHCRGRRKSGFQG